MKKFLSIIVVCISFVLMTGCTTSQRKDTGMIAGGVLGGVAGSALTGGSPAGTIVGAVGGGYLGRTITQ